MPNGRTQFSIFLLAVFTLFGLLHAILLPLSDEDTFEILHNDNDNYIPKPIPLVQPDASNTKLIVNEEGLNFLQSFKEPLVIIGITGRYKTGKSYLWNVLLNLHHILKGDVEGGFFVGNTEKPGTKGLLFWGVPFRITSTVTNETYTVLFMDTEGLNAPGNPVDSYDPKMCTLTMILSSLTFYNAYDTIGQTDINLLHTVVSLSRIFESKLNQTFPFPKLMWIVQGFSLDLESQSADDYLEFTLQEKPNPHNSDEIRRFNETIQVVRSFPKIDSPRVVLLDIPAREKKKDLPFLSFDKLDLEYRKNIILLRQLIRQRIEPKRVGHVVVNGEFLGNIIRNLIHELNRLDVPDVGEAFVKQLATDLKNQCFNKYQRLMDEFALPQDVAVLEFAHNTSRTSAVSWFEKNCIGSIHLHENHRAYTELQKTIDEFHDLQVKNNSLVAHMYCNDLMKEIFQTVKDAKFGSLAEFDEQVLILEKEFLKRARGPESVKKYVLNTLASDISLKRELVMKENAQTDFKLIIIGLAFLFIVTLIASQFLAVVDSQLATFSRSMNTLCVMLILLVTAVFHNLLEIQELIKFTDIQYAFAILRSFSWYINWIISLIKPVLQIIATVVAPVRGYLVICGIVGGVCYMIYANFPYDVVKRKFKFAVTDKPAATPVEPKVDKHPNTPKSATPQFKSHHLKSPTIESLASPSKQNDETLQLLLNMQKSLNSIIKTHPILPPKTPKTPSVSKPRREEIIPGAPRKSLGHKNPASSPSTPRREDEIQEPKTPVYAGNPVSYDNPPPAPLRERKKER